MKKQVYIIEDDVQLNLVVSNFFSIKGFEVVRLFDGLEAIESIDKGGVIDVALYIIDINLPTVSGLEILHYIRERDVQTPIIMITASLEVENFLDAFDAGCSEYIKKPFHIKELQLRVEKLLHQDRDMIRLGSDFFYDYTKKSFLHLDKEIVLRNQESRLIELLVQNKNRVVPQEIIYDFVWGDEMRESYPLRQLVADLRKKIPYDILKTKVKQGYILVSDYEE